MELSSSSLTKIPTEVAEAVTTTTRTTTTTGTAASLREESEPKKSEGPRNFTQQQQQPQAASWNVWKVADRLEQQQNEFFPKVTPQIVSILREWGTLWSGRPEWRSLLDKRSLYHEMEECIVAIHYYVEWMMMMMMNNHDDDDDDQQQKEGLVIVDVCGGKGLLSFLLSFMGIDNDYYYVKEIILLEKAQDDDIQWNHIALVNEHHQQQQQEQHPNRPPHISIWSGTNLHDYDDVLDRFQQLQAPLALIGIHLCKGLGPSFCGLVNGLKDQCVYACLAPCCMPRAVTSQKPKIKKRKNNNDANNMIIINQPKNNNNASSLLSATLQIQLSETVEARKARLEYMAKRQRLKRRTPTKPCFHCHDPDHGLLGCPVFLSLDEQERIDIGRRHHQAMIPCWNCLEWGHYKTNCPVVVERANPMSLSPPLMCLDVSQVLVADRPFGHYCHLLANTMQHFQCHVYETNLSTDNESNNNGKKHADHDNIKSNWNGQRKSIFIVTKSKNN